MRDALVMKHRRIATVASLVACAGVSAALMATPAQADPVDETFLDALGNSGLSGIDPATAVSIGQSVCRMLVEPGQNLADAAAEVANAIGRPLGPATMFTGLAISIFCPAAMSRVADDLSNGVSPIPLDLFGI